MTVTTRRKYRFKDRATAEAEVASKERELHLHRITLDSLLREEFTWTGKFTADNGSWFMMGIARVSHAHGGIVLIREFYQSNLKPYQYAYWADTYFRQWADAANFDDNEHQIYRKCFYALREIYNRQRQHLGNLENDN